MIRGDLMEEGQVLCRQSLKVVPSVSAWVVACRKELSQLPASCPLECVCVSLCSSGFFLCFSAFFWFFPYFI